MKRSMFSIALLLFGVAAVDGYSFPKECVDGVAEWPVMCCPYYLTSLCGSALYRGSCVQMPASRREPAIDILSDMRVGFPGFFFNWTCQCRPKFMGHNCGFCTFGWTGANCNIQKKVIRRSILSLSLAELHRLHAMLHYCKTKIDDTYVILQTADIFRKRSITFKPASYYDVSSFSHYFATKPQSSNGRETYIINSAHGSTAFLFWHRHWLLMLEWQMQRCMQDETIGLPYYPWENSTDCLTCNDLYLGKNGFNGRLSIYSVYSEWRMVCGTDYSQTMCMMEDCICERPRLARIAGYTIIAILPILADLLRCLNMTNLDTRPYDMSSEDSFRQCLEDVHNKVHAYFGGAMNDVPISANDPMFLCHHMNIDRYLNIYIKKFRLTQASYPPNDVYGHTAAFRICPDYNRWSNSDMLQDISVFGVEYE